jgi:serine/threonine protein phosphatase PrpC
MDRQIKQEIQTLLLGSKQDHVAHGSYQNANTATTYWAAALDGHGNDQVINVIRETDLNVVIQQPQFWNVLQKLIDDDITPHNKIKSGSTMVVVKATVYQEYTHIEFINIGDSTGILMVNDKPFFMTTPQNHTNSKEMMRVIMEDRVEKNSPIHHEGFNFEILSDTELRTVEGTYVNFGKNGGYPISPTQTLGHKGITGLSPDITEIRVANTDKIKVLLFSDGVSDMLPVSGIASNTSIPFMTFATNTNEVLLEAQRKWQQSWTVVDYMRTNRKVTTFPKNGYDDCCCAMLTMEHVPIVERVDRTDEVTAAPPILEPECMNTYANMSDISIVNDLSLPELAIDNDQSISEPDVDLYE